LNSKILENTYLIVLIESRVTIQYKRIVVVIVVVIIIIISVVIDVQIA